MSHGKMALWAMVCLLFTSGCAWMGGGEGMRGGGRVFHQKDHKKVTGPFGQTAEVKYERTGDGTETNEEVVDASSAFEKCVARMTPFTGQGINPVMACNAMVQVVTEAREQTTGGGGGVSVWGGEVGYPPSVVTGSGSGATVGAVMRDDDDLVQRVEARLNELEQKIPNRNAIKKGLDNIWAEADALRKGLEAVGRKTNIKIPKAKPVKQDAKPDSNGGAEPANDAPAK